MLLLPERLNTAGCPTRHGVINKSFRSMYPHSCNMYSALCTLHAFGTMYSKLCTLYALGTMYSEICTLYALGRAMYYALCTLNFTALGYP
jgi:hypothetical protein